MITYVFDKLDTADGYEIYWLYKEGEYTNKYGSDLIQPDDLYYDRYAFEERCRDIVLLNEHEGGVEFTNYAFEEDEIELWKAEEREAQEYYNEVTRHPEL